MTSLMSDAFEHHTWATVRLINACRPLDAAELASTVPGTYGSILDTMRHLVGSDTWYLFDLTHDPARRLDEEPSDLDELEGIVDADGAAWAAFLATGPDPDEIVWEVDEQDGFVRDAPVAMRLAQALHHGTDHRSQIATALTALGVEPPGIDVSNYGVAVGRSHEGYQPDSPQT